MSNDASNEYIRKQLEAGYAFDAVVSALVASGWPQAQASQAVASVAQSRQVASTAPQATNDLASLSQGAQYRGPAMRPGNAVAAPCPFCGRQSANKVSFTWWGGLLGPAIMGIVKCNFCSNQFRKNGQKAGGAIAIYFGISLGIGLLIGVMIVLGSMRH